jgi:hypothetical protein
MHTTPILRVKNKVPLPEAMAFMLFESKTHSNVPAGLAQSRKAQQLGSGGKSPGMEGNSLVQYTFTA